MVGRTVAHYAVHEKLGEGGMGVVYKATDTRLDRPVALKLLRPETVANPERRRRFAQEAKAASALNHPNVLHIYDIGTSEAGDFIAMEYVPGRTLDRCIRHRGLPLKEALPYAIQIAEGLAEAHAAGIIHRDLKPGNIIVTDEGTVKILDFGLAKLIEPPETGETAPTRTLRPLTEEGTIVGTAAFMSPEQAEGKKLDARSDVFSFGAVLYEMVTGRRAFTGETRMATLSAVLSRDPEPLPAEIPAELERIVFRCLRKEPGRRFQHMDDVAIALRDVKEESESGKLALRAGPAAGRRHRTLVWTACVAGGIAALSAGVWFGWLRPTPGGSARLSVFAANPGLEWGPALSPDGQQIAFVWNSEQQDNYDIYVQLVDEATPRRLTTDPAMDYSPVWSPDGLRIAFLRQTPGGNEVLIVPSGGGAERRVQVMSSPCRFGVVELARQFCGIAWSPNGKLLSMVDTESPQAPQSIFLLDIQSREKRKVTAPPAGWFGDGVSVFSPDGGTLAFVRTPRPYWSDIYSVALSASGEPRGEPRRITHDGQLLHGLDWTADGGAIVFASTRGGQRTLWRVAASGGEPERLGVGGDEANWPSVSRTGNRLAYTREVMDFNIWRVAVADAQGSGAASGAATLISSGGFDETPTFSADGSKIAFSSNRSGDFAVWVADSSGLHPIRLTDRGGWPAWSPDGRQIVFQTFMRDGPPHVYRVAAEGGIPSRVTTGDFSEQFASWSRDGRWIYFLSDRGGGTAVWKVPAGGGPPVRITRTGARPVLESFDGQYIYYGGRDSRIWRVPTAGGEEMPVLEKSQRTLWTLTESGIYLLDPDAKGGPVIVLYDFKTGARTPIVKFPGGPNEYYWGGGSFSVSPDQRWIVYEHRDRYEADIMLADNFK